MADNGKSNRPLEGEALTSALHKLARIAAIASGLVGDLEPLTDEEKAAGAEPLSSRQIQEELEQISQIATSVAQLHLKANSTEWCAAIDSQQ